MINWKLRFQNKVTLLSIVTLAISIIYFALDLCHVIPPFKQEDVVKLATMVIDFLALIGVLADPTTKGFGDSQRALGYAEPHDDEVR